MLLLYAADVQEFGAAWRGLIFRRESTEFQTLIDESKRMFYDCFGQDNCFFTADAMLWRFKNGASLQFVHMYRDSDVDSYVGQAWPFCAFDECPQFATSKPYRMMLGSVRSGTPLKYSDGRSACRVVLTGNPGGVGIGWIKERFHIPDTQEEVRKASGKPFVDARSGLTRMFLLSLYEENKVFQQADPMYRQRLLAATEGDEELEKAWIYADFSSLFGQYFRQFKMATHCVDVAKVLPTGKVPPNWRLEASFDYGDGSAPSAFHLWATDPEGTSYAIAEYYAITEYPSQAAAGIIDLIKGCPYTSGRRPSKVWCDSQIFWTRASTVQGDPNRYIADFLKRETKLAFVPANKDRRSGWAYVKELLGGPGKKPSMYLLAGECPNLEREFKDAVYSKEIDRRWDIDKECSDHALDATRYFAMGGKKGHILNLKKPQVGMTMDHLMKQAKRARMGIPLRREVPVAVIPYA